MRFNETLINNQDSHSQIENDETPEAEYPNENDSEDTETNKTSTISTFMPQTLKDGEIAKGVNSLNSKQREVFNVVYKWAKDYVICNGHNVEPVYIFFSDSGGTGKSHLVEVIYNAISKKLLYHCKDPDKPDKPRVLLLRPIGISAVKYLLISLINFGLVTLTLMQKNYSKQDLYLNLMKTTQKMPYTCMQKMNLLWREMKLF